MRGTVWGDCAEFGAWLVWGTGLGGCRVGVGVEAVGWM